MFWCESLAVNVAIQTEGQYRKCRSKRYKWNERIQHYLLNNKTGEIQTMLFTTLLCTCFSLSAERSSVHGRSLSPRSVNTAVNPQPQPQRAQSCIRNSPQEEGEWPRSKKNSRGLSRGLFAK